ncbi:MAG: potassium channel protein [bacterium]|nr:potassium channel protein [bacterium]
MSPRAATLIAFCGLLLITVFGSLGFVLIEDMTWFEGLYMTVITVSTVGYGEVRELSNAGRLFTIILIVTAVGAALYLLTLLAQTLIEVSLRELIMGDAMQKKIERLENHVILCGFGRFGRIVTEELQRNGFDMVIIEQNEEHRRDLDKLGEAYVIGSAISDDVLEAAGISRASQIVAATSSDSDNVFITLSARESNPNIRIHARGETDSALRRLRLAGAHHVTSAYQLGGLRMATSVLRPSVVDFLEIARPRFGEEVDLEEIRIADGCELAGQTIRALENQITRLRIVALKRGEDRIQLVPDEELQVCAGDHLVVIGERNKLEHLAQLASP